MKKALLVADAVPATSLPAFSLLEAIASTVESGIAMASVSETATISIAEGGAISEYVGEMKDDARRFGTYDGVCGDANLWVACRVKGV